MSEILAPAGNKESAYAAINAGADAIYLGLDKFSARSSAENFDEQSFRGICRFAHAFGVKVYVALNTVVKEDELENFYSSLIRAWNEGADAIIMQDALLGKSIKKRFPQIILHLSTQAGISNEPGAIFAKQCGFDRVILARETKIEDIAKITSQIETETFIQGALCTCLSGQCYLSSFAGGNSGNRGKCKQPCRKRYTIDRVGFEKPAYRLSLSDLCVGEKIKDLKEAGVTSFKIEGRMRRPEYVAAAVAYYKKILAGEDGTEGAIHDLKRTFNRGNYTTGLSFGQDQQLISSAVQGHIGEFVGTIRSDRSKYVCQCSQTFRFGDGFKILRNGKEVGGGIYGGQAKEGFILSSHDRLKDGDQVFVTTDTALNERILKTKRFVSVNISANFEAGNRAEITVNGVQYFSDGILDQAEKYPLTAEDIKRCFCKVDEYPFKPEFGTIETRNAFMAASVLNAFRRKVYADYYEAITRTQKPEATGILDSVQISHGTNRKIAVIADDLNGIRADIGILKPTDYCNLMRRIQDFSGEKFLYLPPYLTDKEVKDLIQATEGFEGIYCDGLLGAEFAKNLHLKFFAGTGWNITNSVSLVNCPADYVCLSKELTVAEANRLSNDRVFYLTAGNIKVMDLIYCPFGRSCSECDRRKGYTLSDESNRKFPLRRYQTSECRFEVYNCADLVSTNTLAGKLYDFSLEDKKTVCSLLADDADFQKIFKNFTRGHSNSRIL